jgi:hypothetical protein
MALAVAPSLPVVRAGCPQTSENPSSALLAYGEQAPNGTRYLGALVVPPGCSFTIEGRFTGAMGAPESQQILLNSSVGIILPDRFNPGNSPFLYPTSSVKMNASPRALAFSTDMNTSVSFTVKTSDNATGFYLLFFEKVNCPQAWLAVADSPTQASFSDWGFGWVHTCLPYPFYLTITRVQGAWLVPLGGA